MVFTKENQEFLSYDVDAFYYFAGAMLTTVLVPWTIWLSRVTSQPRPSLEDGDFDASVGARKGAETRRCGVASMEVKRQKAKATAMSLRQRLGGWVGLQVFVVACLWLCLLLVLWRLKDTSAFLRSFDPHAILGLELGAELREIKKAYRQKSLQHHPDKNMDNPLAAAAFLQVSKAYAALTDESARMNYEKYGNPDGPTQMKVSVALHPGMIVKENQLMTLCCFFAALLLPPTLVLCCYLGGSRLSAGGVSADTLKMLHACLDGEVRICDGAGYFAASGESRRVGRADISRLVRAMAARKPQTLRPGIRVEIRGSHAPALPAGTPAGAICWGIIRRCEDGETRCEVEIAKNQSRQVPKTELFPLEPDLPCPFSDQPIRRNTALLYAHLWRLHEHMSPAVEADLRALLRHSAPIGRAMTSIAAHGNDDRVGTFEVVASTVAIRRGMVQALDVDSSPLLQIPHVSKVPADMPPLRDLVRDVVSGCGEQLLDKLRLTKDQRLDVLEFCRHVPRVKLACHVEVKDEEGVAEGDLATLTVKLTRANLEEGQAAGPVCAPQFPVPKFEEWAILVYDDRARKLVTVDNVIGTNRTETVSVRFLVPRAGEFRWTVHALCDSYAGLDVECPVPFKCLKKSEVDHEIFVHPDDVNIRTFFEELMMELNPEEPESSDSDDDNTAEASSDDSDDDAPPKPRRPKPPRKAAAKASPGAPPKPPPEALDDSDIDVDGEPEGSFYKVKAAQGIPLFRAPSEEPSARAGTLPAGVIVRGFAAQGEWLELAGSGGAWIRVGSAIPEVTVEEVQPAEDATEASKEGGGNAAEESTLAADPSSTVDYLGEMMNQPLQVLMQTPTPLRLVKRWMKRTKVELTPEDVVKVRDGDSRVRTVVEEMARNRVGDDCFETLLDGADKLITDRRARLSKCIGHWVSQNGIIWRVAPSGLVRGMHPDGSKIRDRIVADPSPEEEEIQIGPFRLDETRTCSCIHWLRKDDPTKQWAWIEDKSLSTRLKLGSW